MMQCEVESVMPIVQFGGFSAIVDISHVTHMLNKHGVAEKVHELLYGQSGRVIGYGCINPEGIVDGLFNLKLAESEASKLSDFRTRKLLGIDSRETVMANYAQKMNECTNRNKDPLCEHANGIPFEVLKTYYQSKSMSNVNPSLEVC